MTHYLTLKQVETIHSFIIEEFGGTDGVRDFGLLESALARPQSGFGDTEMYPDLFTKAAVLMHSLVKNHPFLDGNKRTATTVTGIFLVRNGYSLEVEQTEGVEFVVGVATSKYNEDEIADWLREHSISLTES